MPVYRPYTTEYPITQGQITIVLDDGTPLPAYWSHPATGARFPGIALIHDWWGITDVERHLAHLFAGLGYVVIVPDLFDGRTAASAHDALILVERLGRGGLVRADATLKALEQHSRVNQNVAAVGLGMGGSLAYDVALSRPDLEAVVAYYGFPQRGFGRFKAAYTPILAVYGEHEPFVTHAEIDRLRAELGQSPLAHEVITLAGTGRQFLNEPLIAAGDHTPGTQALEHTLRFLRAHLTGTPRRPLVRS